MDPRQNKRSKRESTSKDLGESSVKQDEGNNQSKQSALTPTNKSSPSVNRTRYQLREKLNKIRSPVKVTVTISPSKRRGQKVQISPRRRKRKSISPSGSPRPSIASNPPPTMVSKENETDPNKEGMDNSSDDDLYAYSAEEHLEENVLTRNRSISSDNNRDESIHSRESEELLEQLRSLPLTQPLINVINNEINHDGMTRIISDLRAGNDLDTESEGGIEESSSQNEDGDLDDESNSSGNEEENEISIQEAIQRQFNLTGNASLLGLAQTESQLCKVVTEILLILKTNKDPSIHNIILQNLSECLSTATEDSLAGFSKTRELMATLVHILKGSPPEEYDVDTYFNLVAAGVLEPGPDSPENQLLACRCLYNFVTAVPGSMDRLAQNGAIPAMIYRLKNLDNGELAEQVFQILKPLSKIFPMAIAKEDGVAAVLKIKDFFSIQVQRTIMQVAANCCKGFLPSMFDTIQEFIPSIEFSIESSDSVIVEYACLFLSNLVESLKCHQDKIELLFGDKALDGILKLLNPSVASKLDSNILNSLLGLVGTLASVSQTLSSALMDKGILDIFHIHLFGEAEPKSDLLNCSSTEVFTSKSLDEIEMILNVANNLLPYKEIQLNMEVMQTTEIQTIVDKFGSTMIPLAIKMYSLSCNFLIKIKSLNLIYNIIKVANTACLKDMLQPLPISAFLMSAIINVDYRNIQFYSIPIAGLLLLKLPKVYIPKFSREGVVSELIKIKEKRSIEDLRNQVFSAPAGKLKDGMMSLITFKASANNSMLFLFEHVIKTESLMSGGDKTLTSDDITNFKLLSTLGVHLLATSFLEEFDNANTNMETEETSKFLIDLKKVALFLALKGAAIPETLIIEEILLKLRNLLLANNLTTNELVASNIFESFKTFFEQQPKAADKRKHAFCKVFLGDGTGLEALKNLISHSHYRINQIESFKPNLPKKKTSNKITLAKRVVTLQLIPDGQTLPSSTAQMQVTAPLKKLAEFVERFATGRLRPPTMQSLFQQFARDIQSNTTGNGTIETAALQHMSAELGLRTTTALDAIETNSTDNSNTTQYDITFTYKGNTLASDALLSQALLDNNLSLDLMFVSAIPIHYKRIERVEMDDPIKTKPLNSRLQTYPYGLDGLFKALQGIYLLNRDPINLEDNNTIFFRLDPSVFINAKITAKFRLQISQQLLVVSSRLPPWCKDIINDLPFLLPFSLRLDYFQTAKLGVERALQKLTSLQDENDNSIDTIPHINSLYKKKIMVPRFEVIKLLSQIYQKYPKEKFYFEFQFNDEVGSGQGPTFEFYSMVFKEFCLKKHDMWRDLNTNSNDDEEYFDLGMGLYPRPLTQKQENSQMGKQLKEMFTLLGWITARAIYDQRNIDLPISSTFIRFILEDDLVKLDLSAQLNLIKSFDPVLLNSFLKILELKDISNNNNNNNDNDINDNNNELSELDKIELNFMLPGYEYELKPKGSTILVTDNNVNDYIKLAVYKTLFIGPNYAKEAFKNGFDKVFPIKILKMFTSLELQLIFGTGEEDWHYQTIKEAIKPEHGYSNDSITIHNLIELMVEFDLKQRGQFLQFLTGRAKLPIGGFKCLTPAITIVIKHIESPLKPDDYLPSVNTCFNYLKLPDYSTKQTLKVQLLKAINEGSLSFHLS